jgi:Zn-finger nucleic acid-binding protein
MLQCPHCHNAIHSSEYKGVYRCGYCHIWLRENEVIKLGIISSEDHPFTEKREVKQRRLDHSEIHQ